MSVRGEFRRILGDVILALRAEDPGRARLADELQPLHERAEHDLSGAAEQTLAILPRLDPGEVAGDAPERLEAVCRVILGRS